MEDDEVPHGHMTGIPQGKVPPKSLWVLFTFAH